MTENITLNNFEYYLNENNSPLSFNLISNNIIERNKYCGTIGLQRFSTDKNLDKDSFVNKLKHNNIINSYSWGLFFFDQNKLYNIDDDTQGQYDGFFIAGVTLGDNIEVFDTDLVYSIYAEEDSLYWALNFDRIFYYERINGTLEYIEANSSRVELIVDLNYIISDEQYFKDIKKYFFQKFFDNDTCHEEKSYKENEGYTYMIICNSDFKNNINSFPGIYFYSEQLFFAFNLYHDDIFYEYNGKIYFLVIHKDSVKNWRLGKIFLKKYPLMFDYDKKIISYVHLKRAWNPKKHGQKKTLKQKDKNINKQSNNKEYIAIILLIVGILIGIFLGKRIWNKNKKLKADELEEKYKYFEPSKEKIGIQ